MVTPRYDYRSGEDPPAVREVKWLLDLVTFLLLGWWLAHIKYRWPASATVINQIPNAMSVSRIPISPLVAWFLTIAIWQQNTDVAWQWFTCVAGLILLDGLDGPLAKQLDAVSDFGKAIDPAADKVLILSLAAAYSALVWRFHGIAVFIPVVGSIIWMTWVEIKLVLVARDTKVLVDLLGDVDLPGANVFGKIKFTIQSLSFLLAFIIMITATTSSIGGLWLAFFMILARFFADKSLGRHRQGVWNLKAIARERAIVASETKSAYKLFFSLFHNRPTKESLKEAS